MNADTDKETVDDEKRAVNELIQTLPEFIETIDVVINPLIRTVDDCVYHPDFSKVNDKKELDRLAYEIFERLYQAREMLEGIRSVVPVLKDTIKKRDKEIIMKDDELVKLQPIVDEVKNNTAAINQLSKELNMVNQGVKSELKSYSDVLQKSASGRGGKTPVNTQNSIRSAVKEVMTSEDRRRNIILFGLEENDDNTPLDNMVESVLLDIEVKPVLGSIVRLGQKSGTCRPVRVSLESSDTVHEILKESPKLKSSANFSKVFISIDRTPEQRIKQKELVCEMKEKIKSDSSKHWKISKGEVVSSEREVISAVVSSEREVISAGNEIQAKEESSSSAEDEPAVTRQRTKRAADHKKCSRKPSTMLSRARKARLTGRKYHSSECGTCSNGD